MTTDVPVENWYVYLQFLSLRVVLTIPVRLLNQAAAFAGTWIHLCLCRYDNTYTHIRSHTLLLTDREREEREGGEKRKKEEAR